VQQVGGQRIVLRVAGIVSWLLSDHLGSTAVTADGVSGVRTAELWYKPWGESRGTPFGATPTTYRFTGQREDASIGLYFYNARYYDPALGRFTQADTIVPQPGNPQALNRYSYTVNNPVKFVDPSGHIPCYGDGPDECSWAGYKDQPAGARRHSLRGYARFLEKQVTVGEMTALDAVIDLWGFAGLYGKDAVTTSDDVSYTLVGSGGTFTLLGGFLLKGKEFLGGASLNLPNFGDTGFNPNYQDGHNQPYHFWANVNTTAQGGNLGKGIGLVANVVHEMADPTEALKTPQERGTSWEDYFLSLKGMEMGQMLRSGELTVDQAGGWMRANLSAPAGPAYDFWKSTGTNWWPSVWMQRAVDLFR
jgi:RHS repeat-associated protein